MTNNQFDKVSYQAHDLIDDHGIVAVKVIFSAYNLADDFEQVMKEDGFARYITRRNRVFIITLSNAPGLPGDSHEMLGYMLATAYQYAPESIKVI